MIRRVLGTNFFELRLSRLAFEEGDHMTTCKVAVLEGEQTFDVEGKGVGVVDAIEFLRLRLGRGDLDPLDRAIPRGAVLETDAHSGAPFEPAHEAIAFEVGRGLALCRGRRARTEVKGL